MNGRFPAGVILLALATLITSLAAGCGPIKQAPKYTDELVTAIGKLTGRSADDAIKYLDDAAAEGKVITQFEAATLTWGSHINAIADDIGARYFIVADDQAAARAFIVGTACDAFKAQQESVFGIVGPTEMEGIVSLNRMKSRRPEIFSRAEFVVEVVAEINTALAKDDLGAAFPGLARVLVCDRLG